MPDDFQYDVFLSHSAKDKPIVREIAERLKKDGLRVWFDEWVLKPGDSIPAKIEEGLERSRVLVLCMSANAFGSDWAQLESGTFRFRDPLNKERRFLPLRLDDAPIKHALVQFLYINWFADDRELEYPRLLDACRQAGDQYVGQASESTVALISWRTTLFENLPSPICIIGSTGIISYANTALCESIASAPSLVIGTAFLTHISSDMRNAVAKLCSDLQSGETRSLVVNLICPDGTYYPATARFGRDANTPGDIIVSFGKISNELALTNLIPNWSSNLLSVLDNLPLQVFVKNWDRTFRYVNKTLASDWGFQSPQELIGHYDHEFYPADLAERFRRDDELVLTHARTLHSAEMHYWHSDLKYHTVQTIKVPLIDQTETVGVLCVFWDDSVRIRAMRLLYDAYAKAHSVSLPSDRIKRSIQFAPEYHQAGVAVLSYFSEIVRQKYPGKPVSVQITQQDRTVTMEIETPDGLREQVEATLNDYGEVIVGGRKPEELLTSDLDVLKLKNKLALANAEIETNLNLVETLSRRNQSLEERLAERNAVLAELFLQDKKKCLLEAVPVDESLFVVFLDLVNSALLTSVQKAKANSSLQVFSSVFGLSRNMCHTNTWGDSVIACFRSVQEVFGFVTRVIAALELEGIRARGGINFGLTAVLLNRLLDRSDVGGATVDFASRLEQCAQPGEVLVGPDVSRHPDCEQFCQYFQVTERTLKKAWGQLPAGTVIECFSLNLRIMENLQ